MEKHKIHSIYALIAIFTVLLIVFYILSFFVQSGHNIIIFCGGCFILSAVLTTNLWHYKYKSKNQNAHFLDSRFPHVTNIDHRLDLLSVISNTLTFWSVLSLIFAFLGAFLGVKK